MRRLVLIALLGAAVALIGCDDGSSGGGQVRYEKPRRDRQCGRVDFEDAQRCDFEIQLYCEYGSVSRAQLAAITC